MGDGGNSWPKVKLLNCNTKEMDAQEFNELLKMQEYDKAAKYEFCRFCLETIKRHLTYRGEGENSDTLSHSILLYFIEHLPKHYVGAPRKYLKACTDHYLSNRKKKRKRTGELNKEVSYEQRFHHLENSEIHLTLKANFDEITATIFFLLYIEGYKEYEIAEMINMSYAAVRQRVSRNKPKLKSVIKNVTITD